MQELLLQKIILGELVLLHRQQIRILVVRCFLEKEEMAEMQETHLVVVVVPAQEMSMAIMQTV